MIGLGRMGAGIGRRLMEHGHEVVAFDQSTEAVEAMAKDGATPANSLEDVVAKMAAPRIFWVMLPAGEPTETTVEALMAAAEPGDIIIDGAASA
jgi:6-phosphogluconate dehydrogenase